MAIEQQAWTAQDQGDEWRDDLRGLRARRYDDGAMMVTLGDEMYRVINSELCTTRIENFHGTQFIVRTSDLPKQPGPVLFPVDCEAILCRAFDAANYWFRVCEGKQFPSSEDKKNHEHALAFADWVWERYRD